MLKSIFAVLLVAAQVVQPAQNQQPFTLKVSTQLVIETVSVRDSKGKSIDDLTEKDFSITEDGVPQTISVFRYMKLDEPAAAAGTRRRPLYGCGAPSRGGKHGVLAPAARGDVSLVS